MRVYNVEVSYPVTLRRTFRGTVEADSAEEAEALAIDAFRDAVREGLILDVTTDVSIPRDNLFSSAAEV